MSGYCLLCGALQLEMLRHFIAAKGSGCRTGAEKRRKVLCMAQPHRAEAEPEIPTTSPPLAMSSCSASCHRLAKTVLLTFGATRSVLVVKTQIKVVMLVWVKMHVAPVPLSRGREGPLAAEPGGEGQPAACLEPAWRSRQPYQSRGTRLWELAAR